MSLMLELSRWIGRAPLNALLEGGSIRSAQKTEFDRLFGEQESAGGVPTPTVWLRKDRPSASPCPPVTAGPVDAENGDSVWRDVGGTGSDQDNAKGPNNKTMPSTVTTTTTTALSARQQRDASREYLEEVDLAKRLKAAAVAGPANDFAVLAGSEKWSDQLKALQMVIDILGPTPKVNNIGNEQRTSND